MSSRTKSILSTVSQVGILTLLALASFTATAFAADTADVTEQSITDLLKPVYDAFHSGKYIAAGALAVIVVVALLKRYAPGRVGTFMHSDVGGTMTTFIVSMAGAVAAASPDGAWHWAILTNAGAVAIAAAGGYTVLKKLVVDKLVASTWYTTKAPSWLKMVLRVVLWVFDKPAATADAIAKSEKAGTDAVAANPSAGANAVVGKPEKF